MKELAEKPYILYVGNAYPHKNLERLILAFNNLIRDGFDCRLILVGEKDRFYKKLKIGGKIIPTGFISDEELDNLYKNSALCVFPSLCEGFGLPPLEAMKRRVPVVCSNMGSLPEILGESAVYFNPLDIDDITEKIKMVLMDNNLIKKLVQKGFEQVMKYSWSDMAEKTLKQYLL